MLATMGERIAYHRKKCKMTQEQLAEKCSVTPQAVSKWENNLSAPDIAIIPRLADLLSVTCDELFGVARKTAAAVDPALVDLNKAVLRVRIVSARHTVYDDRPPEKGGTSRIDLNLPLSVAEAVLSGGILPNPEAMKGIDFKQIAALVKAGVVGKLAEIEDVSDCGRSTVEIWVE